MPPPVYRHQSRGLGALTLAHRRQHPRGEAGTVCVTIEDKSGAVQCLLGPRIFARSHRALRGSVLLVTGTVARWDGATTLAIAQVESIPANVPVPQAHDWH